MEAECYHRLQWHAEEQSQHLDLDSITTTGNYEKGSPADSPQIVTLEGSPPNKWIWLNCSATTCKRSRLSYEVLNPLRGEVLINCNCIRDYNQPELSDIRNPTFKSPLSFTSWPERKPRSRSASTCYGDLDVPHTKETNTIECDHRNHLVVTVSYQVLTCGSWVDGYITISEDFHLLMTGRFHEVRTLLHGSKRQQASFGKNRLFREYRHWYMYKM